MKRIHSKPLTKVAVLDVAEADTAMSNVLFQLCPSFFVNSQVLRYYLHLNLVALAGAVRFCSQAPVNHCIRVICIDDLQSCWNTRSSAMTLCAPLLSGSSDLTTTVHIISVIVYTHSDLTSLVKRMLSTLYHTRRDQLFCRAVPELIIGFLVAHIGNRKKSRNVVFLFTCLYVLYWLADWHTVTDWLTH